MTTPLDDAHAAMEAAPDDDTARLAFHDRIASSEMFLLLTQEPERGDALDPRLFDTSEGRFVLAFDRLERLTEFAEGGSPYAALPGRTLVQMLTGRGIGLALNPGVAPSSHLMAPDAVTWLAETVADAPAEAEEVPKDLTAPKELPERLLTALDGKLASAQGLARMAYLTGVTWESGAKGHLLAFIDAAPGAEGALARAVREALVFSGLEAGALDVTFFPAHSPVAARLARVGLRFDIPKFEPADRKAPGSDPNAPPRLR
ncbi:SseB family protein [Palleronia sp.]|uniref:SseB family protein n=1 Tax=Palleronia sp. TaxID=1940284 RepID=UPI0035C8538B